MFDIHDAAAEIAQNAWETPKRSYGVGKPMQMIMREAPNAGEEAHRIWEKGKPAGELLLDPNREVGVEEAIRNSFAFVQIAGLKGGDSNMVANISTGLTWDRQTPIEDAAGDIVYAIGGDEVEFHWFGPHKLVGFVKGDQAPDAMLSRLVDAPREPYARYFPHLARAQGEIQDIRREDILNPQIGTGRRFLSIFNGEQDTQRAYQDNGKYSFVWGTEKVDDKLMGTNLDNQPQSIAELAIDDDTKQMLEAMEKYFKGTDEKSRYFIEFDFSETVSCCNVSFNAQHEESHVWTQDVSLLSSGVTIQFPNGEKYTGSDSCKNCRQTKGSCTCKKPDSSASTSQHSEQAKVE